RTTLLPFLFLAVLIFGLATLSASTTNAQNSNPMQVFGTTGQGDIILGDTIAAFVEGDPVGTTTANATGWVIDIQDGTDGQRVTFTINGEPAAETVTYGGFISEEVTLTVSAGGGALTAPTFGAGNVGSAVFAGGTPAQLAAAVIAAGGTSVWAQESGGGWLRYDVLATGGTSFVNNAFNASFSGGFPAATAVVVVRASGGSPTSAPPAQPTATPSPSPTPTPTPSPTATPSTNYVLVTPFWAWITSAELSGYTSTSTGAPLVPAWTSCSADGANLGWGIANGEAVSVIARGTGACEGWYVLYSESDDVQYWLPAIYLSNSNPGAGGTSGDVIHTCIDGDFEGWDGDSVFELCNGQVWIQTSYAYTYHYAYRPDVTLVRTASGSWVMSVEGASGTINVKQVTNFVKSRIDGTFEGWSGDTLFPLTNGQVWQQTEYNYTYRYRFMP
ncbi:MAG: hypothetical protein WD396_03975, partial [Pseudohongiellaceae bacterium]